MFHSRKEATESISILNITFDPIINSPSFVATCESYKAPEYLLAGRNENKFLPATTFHRVFSYPALDYIVHIYILSNPHRSQEQKTDRTEDISSFFKETNINIKLEIHLII